MVQHKATNLIWLKHIALVSLLICAGLLFLTLENKPSFMNFGPWHTSSQIDLTRAEKDWLSKHKVIRVGVKNSWKPIEFVTEKKKFRGITIDYLNKLEHALSISFKKVDIDENSTESVDVMSSVSNPKFKGHENYLLTNPILKFDYAIYTHKNTHNIQSLEDLSNHTVTVFKYGQLVKILENQYQEITLSKTDSIEGGFNDIDHKHSDAYIGNEMVVDYEANLQGISFLNKVGYAPVDTELKMAVRKDWPLFLSILNKSLAAMESEKASILSNWNMSIFKKTDTYIQGFITLILLLIVYILYKAYKFKKLLRSKELESQERVWHQAHYDLQTGLANRNLFNNRLSEEILQSLMRNTPIGVLYIDIDSFKSINDQYGHSVGDLLLSEISARLTKSVRSTDLVSRLAGDEFAVLLTELENLEVIEKTANRILQTLQAPFHIKNIVLNITSSIGSVACPKDAQDIDSMIKNADMAMYEAKKQGKNCHKAFTKSMEEKITAKFIIAEELKLAVQRKEFQLYYQPIVDLNTQETIKAEALIRWQHPEKGLLGPIGFIEIAEESNIISQIGDWVFKQALEDIAILQHALNKQFSVSINVSPKQLSPHSLLCDWPDMIKNKGIAFNSIGLEITEGLLIESSKSTAEILHNLRAAGSQILIDDFGTGYSSLSYLKQLDVDIIKIDKSFVNNLSRDPQDMALCEAIVVMAHKLGLKVIAEGVETAEQHAILFEMGCDYGQGYLFSKPVPLAELIGQSQINKHHLKAFLT